MTLEIFTIKDELAGTFGNLMCINPKVKNRTFRWLTEETEKSDCDDKRIYKLGAYDSETGLIQSQTPELVYNMEQEKKVMGEKHEDL
nr:DNA binding protein [Microvirus sp.]